MTRLQLEELVIDIPGRNDGRPLNFAI
ncbi:MAG TPA: ABC transporter, partial [Spongiibacteraceae bacterium]|nr:ABC transporter [Spongiibacteraceae bacterium]